MNYLLDVYLVRSVEDIVQQKPRRLNIVVVAQGCGDYFEQYFFKAQHFFKPHFFKPHFFKVHLFITNHFQKVNK